MFGHLGFSYVGLIFVLLLIVPNILFMRRVPADFSDEGENGVLLLLERMGQVGCIVCALMFSNFNFVPFTPWSIWLVVAFVLMGLYEFCWFRYFKGKQNARYMYRSFFGIPIPLAVFPVAAFLLLGIYGQVLWMILFAVILGIGHIGIHWYHAKRFGIL
ncbi:MAG: hypothetical protein VB081_06995 [Christensenella sp.]|uniref:hypothetical protein n=1 Tax=Christensenella sp. TaxID=1935934 RepID=UPI002B208AAB|nr:hypothetical protein [Christensenella sp.]MEA5003231.1 hypothetical protein [Christensenella sp.]